MALTPEESLLLACASGQAPAAPPADLRWERWLELALANSLDGFAHREALRWAEAVPAPIRQRLARHRLASQAFLLRLRALRDLALARLEQQGLEPICLKGAFLAEALYPEPALRPMSDLDLLVRPEHFDKAADALRRLGLRPPASKNPFLDGLRLNHNLPFAAHGLQVELHWQLFPPHQKNALLLPDLWHQPWLRESGGRALRGLRPALLLPHLLHHLQKHWQTGEFRLVWYLDLALLWQSMAQGDKDEALRLLEANALLAFWHETAHLLDLHFRAGIGGPRPALAQEQELRFERLLRGQWERLPREGYLSYRKKLALVPGLARKLRFLWHELFPDWAYLRQRFGQELAPAALARLWLKELLAKAPRPGWACARRAGGRTPRPGGSSA